MANDRLPLSEIFKAKYKKSWQDDLLILWKLSRPYIGRLVAAMHEDILRGKGLNIQ